MEEVEIRVLAEEHWKYIEEVIRTHDEMGFMIDKIKFHYITAFIHGFGHGFEQCKNNENSNGK